MAALVEISLPVLRAKRYFFAERDDPWMLGRHMGAFYQIISLLCVGVLIFNHFEWSERLIGIAIFSFTFYAGRRLIRQRKWAVVASYPIIVGALVAAALVGFGSIAGLFVYVVEKSVIGAIIGIYVIVVVAWFTLNFDLFLLFTLLVYYPSRWKRLGGMYEHLGDVWPF